MNYGIMLIYPPGKQYQRGEDRSQGNIENSTATAIRAPNDIGYCAAVLEKSGYHVFLKDYQTERKSFSDFEKDLYDFNPAIIMISITNATILDDIDFVNKTKNICRARIVLKGALFYDVDQYVIDMIDLSNVDYLIGGEAETCINHIADYSIKKIGDINNVDNILYKNENNVFIKNRFNTWEQNLDNIPFPAREYMSNNLYVRPDTGEPMATIQTSRGCPGNCIYCLTPIISGKEIRYRTPENIMLELNECYYKYNIRNFFFKADTFTMNAQWVESLCKRIIDSPLYGKIEFTANARVSPLHENTIALMKKAGCFAIAFGFESGSNNTLRQIKKGTTIELNLRAAAWAKKASLPIYGFFMIGFPWETEKDIELTRKHILEINADFIEVHIALPYYGTPLYSLIKQEDLLCQATIGNDYFNSNIKGTRSISIDRLIKYRKEIIKDYYTRPSYIFRQIRKNIFKPTVIKNYIAYGLKVLKNE